MTERRRLPDGSYTRSATRYCREWTALERPFKKLLGWRLCAFDPDLMFARPYGTTVNVAPELAFLVMKLAKREGK